MAHVRLYVPYLIVHQTIIILFSCLNNKQIKQDLTSHTYRESLYFLASSAGIFLPINGPKKSCLGITHLANTPRPALGMLDSLTSSPGGTITSACATVESNQRIKILEKSVKSNIIRFRRFVLEAIKMSITSMKQNDTACTCDYITSQTIGFNLTGKMPLTKHFSFKFLTNFFKSEGFFWLKRTH